MRTKRRLRVNTEGDKARRKNAPRACVICAARKVSCGLRRPCERCVKAGKEHLCVDIETKRRKRVGALLRGTLRLSL